MTGRGGEEQHSAAVAVLIIRGWHEAPDAPRLQITYTPDVAGDHQSVTTVTTADAALEVVRSWLAQVAPSG